MTPQQLGAESIVTADQMRARLAELKREAPAPPLPAVEDASHVRWALRTQAVLLDYFSASDLTPGRRRRERRADAADADSTAVHEFVTTDCEVVTTRTATRWRLKRDVRQATLARLGPSGALASLRHRDHIDPGKDDVTHHMARRLLEGNRELDGLSPTELSGLLRARDWLAEMGLDLPTEADVRRALDLANVLAPLKAVARADFVGREHELALLEAFLTSPGSEPFAIHGPGGVGKSALVAKFVLDRVEGRADRIPFAYLTFDRAELDPQFPLTLIREAIRQIALQEPKVASEAAVIIQDIDRQLVSESALRDELSWSSGHGTRDIDRSAGDENFFQWQLGKFVNTADSNQPYLLILDTFEVAQRRRRSSLEILHRTLQRLRSVIPALRIVIAGRAEAPELTKNQHDIGGLTQEQAQHLLRLALGDLRVSADLLAEVAERVNGNPLSLRLAAELMCREGAEALASSRGRRRFLFGLREEQVQGILYRRILDHIDAAVRPLANPGLVVRRITPEVIEQVLAKPCGLGEITAERAQQLFDVLRGDVSLVTEKRPGVLVHRADVRQEMLPLLAADDKDRVAEIHRRAIAYYTKRTAPDDAVEHLYHRLMLGQSKATLDRYWDLAASAALEPSMPELPASSRVYLANTLPDAEVDPADLAAVDEDTWVRQVTRQARRLLDSGQSVKALRLLDGGPVTKAQADPSVSLLRIEALASTRQRHEAIAVALQALERADNAGQLREYVELAILTGRVAEDADNLPLAEQWLTTGRETALDLGARIPALTAGAGVLRVQRRSGIEPDASPARRLRGELTVEVAGLSERDKASNPGLMRELAAELGDDVPDLLADAATHLGVDTSTAGGGGGLSEEARVTIERTTRERLVADPDYLGPQDPGYLGPQVASSAATGKALADALKEAPDDEFLRGTVKQYWQSEADRPSFDYYDDQGK